MAFQVFDNRFAKRPKQQQKNKTITNLKSDLYTQKNREKNLSNKCACMVWMLRMYAHVSINCPIFALFEIFKVFAMCNICRLCYMLLLQHILVSHLMLLLLLADSKVKLLCEYFMFLHLTSGCILKTHSIESTLYYFLIETTKSWRNFNSSKSHHWNFMLEERGTGKSEGSFLIGNVFLIVSSDDGHHLPCFWCWFSLLSSRFPFFFIFFPILCFQHF